MPGALEWRKQKNKNIKLNSWSFFFKGYLRYKIITSQNVSFEAQVHLRQRKNYILFSRYSSFCIFNHPMIYQISDVMMNISTLDRVPFWPYLLNHNSLSCQTWPIDRSKQYEKCSGIFQTIWIIGAKFQVTFYLTTCSYYLITNYVKIPVFYFFENVNKGHLKMVNVNYKKWPDLAILSF